LSGSIDNQVKVKVNTDIEVRNRNYHTATGNHAIWDHTVLSAIRQRWFTRLYPSRSWYST